jgi:hypothetical protein
MRILDRVGVFGDTADMLISRKIRMIVYTSSARYAECATDRIRLRCSERPVRHSPDFVILTELLGSQCTVVLRVQYIDR